MGNEFPNMRPTDFPLRPPFTGRMDKHIQDVPHWTTDLIDGQPRSQLRQGEASRTRSSNALAASCADPNAFGRSRMALALLTATVFEQ